MSLRLGAVKSCGDCRRKAECSLIKGKDAKVFPKEKQKNEAPFLKEWGTKIRELCLLSVCIRRFTGVCILSGCRAV